MRLPAALLAAALILIVTSSASAQSRCIAPPGSSAVDQYCEVVPDGSGGHGADRNGTQSVPKKTANQLARAGAAGDAVLSLAGGSESAKPTGKSSGGTKSQRKAGTNGAKNATGSGDQALPDSDAGASNNNLIEATAASTGDATRIGSGFMWLLIVAVVAVSAWGWASYRRRHD